MKNPVDVACPECAQQPGEACRSGGWFAMVSPTYGVHLERVEAAQFINNAEAGLAGNVSHEPTQEQFQKALLGTGELFCGKI